MKLRYRFAVRKVGERTIAVAVGRDNERFNGMVKLNTSGEFVFKLLNGSDVTEETIISTFAAQYGIPAEGAKTIVLPFIDYLRQKDLLEE